MTRRSGPGLQVPLDRGSAHVRSRLHASGSKKRGAGGVSRWCDVNSDPLSSPEPRGWCNVLIVSGRKLKHVGWRLGIY
jgi:hypothetical protein